MFTGCMVLYFVYLLSFQANFAEMTVFVAIVAFNTISWTIFVAPWDSLPHWLHSCLSFLCFRALLSLGPLCLVLLLVLPLALCSELTCVVSASLVIAWSCCLVASSVRAISVAFLSVRLFPWVVHFFLTTSESTPNTSASLSNSSWSSDK